MTTRAVELLRAAAHELAQAGGANLLIPEPDSEDETYPLGLPPGSYGLSEVASAVQFLADMLE